MSPLLLSPCMSAVAQPCASAITVSVLSQAQTQAHAAGVETADVVQEQEHEREEEAQPNIQVPSAEAPSADMDEDKGKEDKAEQVVDVPVNTADVATAALEHAGTTVSSQVDETVYVTPPVSSDALVGSQSADDGGAEDMDDAENATNQDADVHDESRLEAVIEAEESVLEDSDKENELRPSKIKEQVEGRERPRTPLAVAQEFEVEEPCQAEVYDVNEEGGELDVTGETSRFADADDVVSLSCTEQQVQVDDETAEPPRGIKITVRGGIIQPLGIPVPTTYADASNVSGYMLRTEVSLTRQNLGSSRGNIRRSQTNYWGSR